MNAAEGLTSLYALEEKLRAESLAAIEADAALSDHWSFVAETMRAIYVFTHDHVNESENELTLLALSGYYQKAFHQVRDIIGNVLSCGLSRDLPREDRRMETC